MTCFTCSEGWGLEFERLEGQSLQAKCSEGRGLEIDMMRSGYWIEFFLFSVFFFSILDCFGGAGRDD